MTKSRFKEKFAKADAAFKGEHKNELEALGCMSEEELASVIPDTTDRAVYNELINIINQATENNLSQATLIENIKSLGEIAVNIAKKLPKFKDLL